MADMQASLFLNLRGNLASGLTKLGHNGQRSLRGLGRAASLAGRGLDRLGNRYTALLGGAAGIGTGRQLIGLEARLTQLGVQAGKSAVIINALQAEIYRVAKSPHIRVDPSQILDAVDKIVEKTGNLDLAKTNIENIGKSIRATGAAGTDIGAMIADMNEKFGLTKSDEFLQSLDALVNQGKAGAFTLQNMATQGERITAAYGTFNRTGPTATKEMGAMMQMIKRGVGAPEQAATAFEALVRTLNDGDSRKKLQRSGIKIVDPDEPKRLRSVIEIVKDVVRATNGDVTKISSIFDAEAMRAFNGAVIEFNQTGGFASFDKFLSVSDNGSQILEDSTRNAKTAAGALTNLGTVWKSFADSKLTKPIQDLTAALDGLSPERVDEIMSSLATGAMALGGLVVASKAIRTMAAAKSLFGGRRGKGAAGMLGGMAGGAQPVMVTNWPGGAGGGWGLDMPGGKSRGGKSGGIARTGKLGRLARGGQALARLGSKIPGAALLGKGGKMLGKLGGRGFAPLAALMYGTDFVGSAMAGNAKGMGRSAGGLGGGLAGAAAGAAIGSVIPGIGTLIGGLAGGILGSLGGESLGEMLGGTLKIEIESDQPAKVKGLKSNSKSMDIDVDTGLVMAGGG